MYRRQIYIPVREPHEVNSKSPKSWATTAREVSVHISCSWATSQSTKAAFQGNPELMQLHCNNLGCKVSQFSSPNSRVTFATGVPKILKGKDHWPHQGTPCACWITLISLKKGLLLSSSMLADFVNIRKTKSQASTVLNRFIGTLLPNMKNSVIFST